MSPADYFKIVGAEVIDRVGGVILVEYSACVGATDGG